MQADVCDLDDDHLLSALDSLRDVFAVFDDRDRLVYWNEHAQRRSGYSAAELAQMRPEQLVVDADLPQLHRYLQQVRRTGRSTVEVRLVTKDGEAVPHELYSDLLTDRDGTVLGRVVVGRDVSERVAYERILEHKNDRLAEFAQFVSHDVRNPLAVASGQLELYHRTGDDAHFRQVRAAHRRIEDIVDDLLRMTAATGLVAETTAVDLVAVAQDAWGTVVRSDLATLRIDGDDAGAAASEAVGSVVADSGLLRQALENLFHNAIQHGDEGVTVAVGRFDEGFYVEDDGPGFPDDADSLFEVGVTTRPDGTGFGLAIVDEIASMHGWSVHAGVGAEGGARIEFGEVQFADTEEVNW